MLWHGGRSYVFRDQGTTRFLECTSRGTLRNLSKEPLRYGSCCTRICLFPCTASLSLIRLHRPELWVTKDPRVAAAWIAVLEAHKDVVCPNSLRQNDRFHLSVSYDKTVTYKSIRLKYPCTAIFYLIMLTPQHEFTLYDINRLGSVRSRSMSPHGTKAARRHGIT
jgi:hypothetical protein